MARNEADKEAIAEVHEIVDLLEDALYQTVRAAKYEKVARPRQQSKKAWHKLADKIIDFALKED